MNSTPVIRPIEERDVAALFALMAALARHEGESHELIVTPDDLRESGFGSTPKWRGLLAEHGGMACGYATYTESFHIWSGAPHICLDDLYVLPDMRGRGIGEQLMRAIFDMAILSAEDAYVSWAVQADNDRAIAFYERLGAKVSLTGKCGWRAASKQLETNRMATPEGSHG